MHLLTSSAKLHAFLTHRYDDRPHFITPTTPADLERLTSLAKALEAESSQFRNHAQSGLASTLHLPTWYEKMSDRRHVVALTDAELHTLKGTRGLLIL
jgi:hypothetical protein